MKKKNIHILLILLVSTISCSKITYNGIRAKNWKVISEENQIKANFDSFSGDTFKEIKVDTKNNVHFNFDIELDKGYIIIALLDDRAMPVWISDKIENKKRLESSIKVLPKKKYKIYIQGKNASGNFNITWKLN